MSNIDIIRAWKDEEYRNSLSAEQRSQLPENPCGLIQLSDEEMESVSGGTVAQTRLPLELIGGAVAGVQLPRPPREFFVAASTYFITGCDVFPNG